jgi:hypothetical protein
MDDFSGRIDRSMLASLVGAMRTLTAYADRPADFLASIGYEAADPTLLGLAWREQLQDHGIQRDAG